MNDLSPFTGFGDDTNTSVKFSISAPGGVVPLWTLEPRGTKLPVPHSNRTIIQASGLGEWSVTFRVEVDTTDELELLQALQYQRATLRYRHRVTNNPGGTITTLQGVSYVVLPDTLLDRVSNETREVEGSTIYLWTVPER